MHPACSDGEDEKGCTDDEDSYVKKNNLTAGASFRCQSPHYPDLVEILAVRSDMRIVLLGSGSIVVNSSSSSSNLGIFEANYGL